MRPENTVVYLVCILVKLTQACGRLEGYGKRATSVDPEVTMNTSQLITSKGYPCEEYDVVTDDGYILTVQRIPYGLHKAQSDVRRPVVLLQHGLLSCSACWVENLANESLGFIFADAGFDVWLGNSRGNTYARRHRTLTPEQKEFWAFSWDEMAQRDLPATVDKILSTTGAEDLFYVGHSQGGAIGYGGFSFNASIARKIRMFAALAPAVYVKDMISPVGKLTPFSRDFIVLAKLLGLKDFMPYGEVYTFFAENVCNHDIPSYLCENVMFLICGFDQRHLNRSRIPVYIGQHPAGTSVQNIIHFAQMNENDFFQMFDYGPAGNLKKYHQTTPPKYNISAMHVPVAMYNGGHDWLIVPSEVSKLEQQTQNLVWRKQIADWNHLDFMWAMDAPEQCYNGVVALFKEHSM